MNGNFRVRGHVRTVDVIFQPKLIMSAEPATKKQKLSTKNRVMLLQDFHMTDCALQPFVKSSKCNLVPLLQSSDNTSPILIQMNGGGVIPRSFGIDDKEVDGRRKVQFAFQIQSVCDHEHLDRLRGELGALVVQNWKKWFPDATPPSNEMLLSLGGSLVSQRKKKKNSEDLWSGVSKASIEPEDCASGKCKIVDSVTGAPVPFDQLPGMTWNKIILELRYVFIQATKSYGISKKLRYLSCTPVEDDLDLEPL